MPPAKRAPRSPSKSNVTADPAPAEPSAPEPTTSEPAATEPTPAAKATATTARKSARRTTTQAKSATTKTTRTARSGAAKTAAAAEAGVKETAAAAAETVQETAASARAGAKGTATAARRGAQETGTRAKAARTQAKHAGAGSDTVTLTRAQVQDALDDAAARGRITRKDADDLLATLMGHGRVSSEDVGDLIGKNAKLLGEITHRVRRSEPVDRLVRGADRARRAAGVGPSFPIIGYDELTATQVLARVKELSAADQRKVLSYEQAHAARKTVVGSLERTLA